VEGFENVLEEIAVVFSGGPPEGLLFIYLFFLIPFLFASCNNTLSK
jgi:hypothetical protein